MPSRTPSDIPSKSPSQLPTSGIPTKTPSGAPTLCLDDPQPLGNAFTCTNLINVATESVCTSWVLETVHVNGIAYAGTGMLLEDVCPVSCNNCPANENENLGRRTLSVVSSSFALELCNSIPSPEQEIQCYRNYIENSMR